MLYNAAFDFHCLSNTVNCYKKLQFFKGTMPTQEEMESYYANSNHYGNLPYSISQREGEAVVAESSYSTNQVMTEISADGNTYLEPIAKRDAYMNVVLADTPITWFALFYAESSNYSPVIRVVWGTVGDIGSGADLEIPGGQIAAGSSFKPNDIKLNLERV